MGWPSGIGKTGATKLLAGPHRPADSRISTNDQEAPMLRQPLTLAAIALAAVGWHPAAHATAE